MLGLRNFCPALLVLLALAGCDSSSSQEAMLKEQMALLQNQVKSWQEHYTRLLCLQEALLSLQSLDQALEEGLSLEAYQKKIAAADLLLAGGQCLDADKEPLLHIMSCHHLAARIWAARIQGRGAALAEDYIAKVYPLWLQFEYPPPREMSHELRQALADYNLAAPPQARQYLEQVRYALDSPPSLAFLAAIGNQLLWHEAHNKLTEYKNRLLTPPYPLQ